MFKIQFRNARKIKKILAVIALILFISIIFSPYVGRWIVTKIYEDQIHDKLLNHDFLSSCEIFYEVNSSRQIISYPTGNLNDFIEFYSQSKFVRKNYDYAKRARPYDESIDITIKKAGENLIYLMFFTDQDSNVVSIICKVKDLFWSLERYIIDEKNLYYKAFKGITRLKPPEEE